MGGLQMSRAPEHAGRLFDDEARRAARTSSEEPFMPAHIAPKPKAALGQSSDSIMLPIDEEVERLVLVTKKRTLPIPAAWLMAEVRRKLKESNIDLPAEAKLQVSWCDREEESPFLADGDNLQVVWNETKEAK